DRGPDARRGGDRDQGFRWRRHAQRYRRQPRGQEARRGRRRIRRRREERPEPVARRGCRNPRRRRSPRARTRAGANRARRTRSAHAGARNRLTHEHQERRLEMKISEIMTPDPELIDPTASIRDAAQRMKNEDIGALPVGENDRLIGMVTDRDITMRAVAEDRLPSSTSVRDVMSEKIYYCFEDD